MGKNHVPVTSPAYQQPLIRAHSQPVQDLVFNPHNPQQLLSSSADGTVKIWSVPEEGYLVDESSATAVLVPTFGGTVKGVVPHGSAENVLAARGVKDVALFDLGTGAQNVHLTSALLGGSELHSLSWSYLGDKLISVSKDKNLRLIDPRAGAVETQFECHGGQRNLKATWLGDTPYFFSCGLNAMQQREFAVWDSRMVGGEVSPVRRERVDSGRGLLLPIFDADNNLLILAGKGDVTLRLYEFDRSKNDMFAISNVNIGDSIKGACLMPKQANNLLGCEVLRVLKTTENSVQPISFTVPRREKLQFHSDLFPPTKGEEDPCMTAEEWFGGANTPSKLVTLSPPCSAVPEKAASALAPTTASANNNDKAARSVESNEVPLEAESSINSPSRPASTRASLTFGSSIGSNKFKHLFGTESPKNASYFNLKPYVGTSESPLITCSEKFWAIPWQGTGGPVYVSKHGAYGKVNPTAAIIDGHRGAVQDLSFSPFHPNILSTASDDCKVKIWNIPDEGILEQNFVAGDEVASLDSHTHSVRTCNFHPTVAGFMATSSYDMSIKFWDLENASSGSVREVKSLSTGFGDMGSGISNLSFNYDGSLFAVSCRDRAVRICDIRSRLAVVDEVGLSDSSIFSSSTTSSALGRNLRVAWCGSPSINVILTTSAAMSTGMRQIQLWDPRKLSEPIAVRPVDNASGALYPLFDPDTSVCFVAGRGDTSIRYYDISASDDAPAACTLLNQFQGSIAPIGGVCLLPKTSCNVRAIETNKLLKLAGDTVTSVSFVLPRADHLKEFFQDDIFPETQCGPTLSCSEWLTDTNKETLPVLTSVKPEGMAELSSRRASLPTTSTRSKVDSFRAEQQRQEEENKQKADMLNKMQEMALQRATYHPNPSGGAKAPDADNDDSSDGGWDD